MHARITSVEGSPDQVDQANAFVEQSVLPGMREMDGFRGVISLADREHGRGLTLTLWDTKEAMEASEEAANQMRGEAVQAVGGSVTGVDRYEVTISEMA